MATFEVICSECQTPALFDGHLPFREECERCSADLHICLTCRFHDRFAADECRETSADPVARKDRRNLCEYWKPKSQTAEAETAEAAAKAKLAALLAKRRRSNPQRARKMTTTPTQKCPKSTPPRPNSTRSLAEKSSAVVRVAWALAA